MTVESDESDTENVHFVAFAHTIRYIGNTMAINDDFLMSGDDAISPPETTGPTTSISYDEEETLVTKEGLRKLKEELDYLKGVRRKEVAQRLKEAISYGDLSENSEYEEAKNEQAFIEGRIIDLERKIKSAKIISEKEGKSTNKEVSIGSSVTVRDLSSGDQEEETFTIVGATEADPTDFRISNESPIGKSLLNKVKGETVKVHTPSGDVQYEILKVA